MRATETALRRRARVVGRSPLAPAARKSSERASTSPRACRHADPRGRMPGPHGQVGGQRGGVSDRCVTHRRRRPRPRLGAIEPGLGRIHSGGPEPLSVPETPSDRGSLDLLDPDEWNKAADRAARERAERRRARAGTPRPPRSPARGARRRTTAGRHALGPAAHRLRRGAGARHGRRSGRAVALTAPSRSVAGVRRQNVWGNRDRGARRALPGTGRPALPAT